MTKFRIGTYNVQNLFDRFDDPYSIGDDMYGRFRTTPKSRAKLFDAGKRIRENGVKNYPIDIVGLQEIENFGALLDFVQGSIGPEYRPKTGIVSLPSNDFRGIDLGLIVRTNIFRIGRVISHKFYKFRRSDGELYQFSRDCLQVEILEKESKKHVLTIFNCHFKSKYTGIDEFKNPDEYEAEQKLNTIKREAEAKEVLKIVSNCVDIENDLFVILGDFNDNPNSEPLKPLLAEDNELGVYNAVADIPQDDQSPSSPVRRPRDTHHWERPLESGDTVDEWSQMDYILCSKKLWSHKTGVVDVINQPKNQGSDHYLSFVEFDIDFNSM
jgi:hypothetical protein